MKILHTSDLHLGLNLYGLNMTSYQQKIVPFLKDIIASENIDVIIIAGDVFDTSLASAESIKVWSDLCRVVCGELHKTVVVCAGNHDGAARLSSCSELLKAAGLHINGILTDTVEAVIIDDTAIYSVPYFNATDAARIYECEKTNAAFVMNAVLDKIRANMDKSKKNILVSHCFVMGGEVSDSDNSARASAAVGGADHIPASVFDGFDYVALGHLHKSQTIKSKGDGIVRYSGTPNAYSFSEAGQIKSATIYDTDTKTISEITFPTIFNLREISGTYDEIIALAKEDLHKDNFMKIVVKDKFKSIALYSEFKEIYPNLLQFGGAVQDTDGTSKLSAKEISELDIISLFYKYYEDNFVEKPSDEQVEWLKNALAETEKEDLI